MSRILQTTLSSNNRLEPEDCLEINGKEFDSYSLSPALLNTPHFAPRLDLTTSVLWQTNPSILLC